MKGTMRNPSKVWGHSFYASLVCQGGLDLPFFPAAIEPCRGRVADPAAHLGLRFRFHEDV